MVLLLLYFLGSVLMAGAMGGWALRAAPSRGTGSLRWGLILFPLGLVTACQIKPHGPGVWLHLVQGHWAGHRVALAFYIALVVGRGMGKGIGVWLVWAKWRQESVTGHGLREAPWLGYDDLCQALDISRRPEIRFHHALPTPVVVGWRTPLILFPAAWVPAESRDGGPFWADLPTEGKDRGFVRTVMAHELAHVRRADPLRRMILALNGCLVPWEWMVEAPVAGRPGPVSRGLALLGRPFLWALRHERRMQEFLADETAIALLGGGGATWPHFRTRSPPFTPAPAPGRLLLFWAGTAVILGCAPGASTIHHCLEGKVNHLRDLPQTWSLVQGPGLGDASAGLLPGEYGRPGKILVHVRTVTAGPGPYLAATGHFLRHQLPPGGWVELAWDVQQEEGRIEDGRITFMIAAFRMTLDTEQGSVSVEGVPLGEPETLADGFLRHRRRIPVDACQAGPTWLLLRYSFLGPGRWAFRAPRLEIVSPDGGRRGFPST